MSDQTVQPTQQPDHRAEFVAGLREFADWIEEHPEMPISGQPSYKQPVRFQVNLDGTEGLTRVRYLAAHLGLETDESLDDRTGVEIRVGSASYSVIAWHREGRKHVGELEKLRAELAEMRAQKPLVSDATIEQAGHAAGTWNEREERWESAEAGR